MSKKKGRHRKQLPTSSKDLSVLSDPVTRLGLLNRQVIITHHDFDACLMGLHDNLKGDRAAAGKFLMGQVAEMERNPAEAFQADNVLMFFAAYCYAQTGYNLEKSWEMIKAMPEITTVEYED